MFAFVLLFVFLCFSSAKSDPLACFNSSDLISLHNCLAINFAQNNSLSEDEWNSMLPTSDEISQLKQLVKAALDTSDPAFCSSGTLSNYPLISDDITMRRFQSNFCVIVEKNIRPLKTMFNRCWGYMIIADKSWSKRNLHHSAPHPVSELYTSSLAINMFNMTQSRSLISAGASRDAVGGVISPCIADDLVADAAHDNRTMFHALSATVFEHERASCPHDSCAFIQWHSYANGSCNDTQVIISAGVDNSGALYDNETVPAMKIAMFFNQLGRPYAKTAKESSCTLLALDNIQGRLINGVDPTMVCTTNPTMALVSGSFVNINQEEGLEDVNRWSQTIAMAFLPLSPGIMPVSAGLTIVPNIWAAILIVFVAFYSPGCKNVWDTVNLFK